MALPSIYDPKTTDVVVERIEKLTNQTTPKWGKMSVSQMLAHCCVPYEQIFGEKTERPPYLIRVMLKMFLKNTLVNEVPYKQNARTAPAFIIADERDFEREKKRLIDYIVKVEKMGASALEGKESNSVGILTAHEWSNMLYKHLDHHFRQFGV